MGARAASGRFPRPRRLVKASEYQRVFAEGVRTAEGPVVVLAAANVLGYPRLGLAVARRHVRCAVHRNRLKRLIRESFRRHQHELGGMDLVVIVRQCGDQVDIQTVNVVLRRHWRWLGIRKRLLGVLASKGPAQIIP